MNSSHLQVLPSPSTGLYERSMSALLTTFNGSIDENNYSLSSLPQNDLSSESLNQPQNDSYTQLPQNNDSYLPQSFQALESAPAMNYIVGSFLDSMNSMSPPVVPQNQTITYDKNMLMLDNIDTNYQSNFQQDSLRRLSQSIPTPVGSPLTIDNSHKRRSILINDDLSRPISRTSSYSSDLPSKMSRHPSPPGLEQLRNINDNSRRASQADSIHSFGSPQLNSNLSLQKSSSDLGSSRLLLHLNNNENDSGKRNIQAYNSDSYHEQNTFQEEPPVYQEPQTYLHESSQHYPHDQSQSYEPQSYEKEQDQSQRYSQDPSHSQNQQYDSAVQDSSYQNHFLVKEESYLKEEPQYLPQNSYMYNSPYYNMNPDLLPPEPFSAPINSSYLNILPPQIATSTSPGPVGGKFQCPFPDCGKTFTKQSLVNAHQQSHTRTGNERNKPFCCDQCPQAFSRSHGMS
ncbi:hypothetical protein BC833DRAFT_607176 [Globomyces pollinis-pini]|nr:hypothetical protein BC833DRAFT_607176 [Globomyces pollinis-pini]KAJ2991406.1 hypothetical protein HDV02_003790 [Globomyces sp. JEL0801]